MMKGKMVQLALIRACRTGQSESVMFLLAAGADVNNVKPDGNTCLHVAVHGNCSKETLQNIIEHGLNVNTANKRGETALILACESAQAEFIEILLKWELTGILPMEKVAQVFTPQSMGVVQMKL